MEKSNLNDKSDLAKVNENNFYKRKIKNINDSGIYHLFKNLSSNFCNSKYHKDKTDTFFDFKDQNEIDNYVTQWKANCKKAKLNSKECFNPPSFSWAGNDYDKKFEPFIFFETVAPEQIQDDEAIVNYVKQFVCYINQLLSESDFCDFVFYEFAGNGRNKNIAELANKIDSDFFTECDEANLKLFKDSGLLYVAG